MLAARTAAEIPPGQQDARPGIFRPVQHELRVVGAVVPVAPVEEQKLAEAGPLDPLEELLGNDLIGIDVRPVQRSDQAGVGGEGVHGRV